MIFRSQRRQLSLPNGALGWALRRWAARRRCAALLVVLWGLGRGEAARGQGAVLGPALYSKGARCRLVTECTQFDSIGLHLGSGVAVRAGAERSGVDAHGLLRLSLTAGEVAEAGAVLSGHLWRDGAGELRLVGAPLALFARFRLLPLPWGPLAAAPLRRALSYEHELVADSLGRGEPPGWSRGTLRLVAGQRLGRVELDGSVGLVLAGPSGERPRVVGFALEVGASLRLLGGGAGGAELSLTAEALARAAVASALPGQQAVLLGVLGKTARGYGGGVALGAQVLEGQAGVLVVARMQIAWGKAHRNPWAERKAAEPRTTPAFIWMLIGAIDPVLGADGCVWTDPKPRQPSRQWFCIGHPAPDDPQQIVLPDKQRIAVGTHLWEFGKALWLNDGSKVVEIPLLARFRQKVWEYLAEHWAEVEAGSGAAQPLCEGKIGQLHGLDQGSAMMVANDDGGAAALLGAELLRELQCSPDQSLRDQAWLTANVLGILRGRGPLRARPPLSDRLGDGSEGAAASRRAGGGRKDAEVAEHAVPPRLGPAIFSEEAKAHIFKGDVNKRGLANGWHYEPTGEAQRGTYVLESTRSPVDPDGVYVANVMIEGAKKKARSSFVPAHWTPHEIETAIEEAYRNRAIEQYGPGVYRGTTNRGVLIEMRLWSDGSIQSAYPVYNRGR